LEGGTRVPCIIRYPETLQAGEITDQLIAAIDLLPTLAGACGIELQKGSGISLKMDGLNLWESLKNETSTLVRTNLLYWNGWATPQAIRVGKWKLYFDRIKELDDSEKGPVLIDLTEDPGEKNNLAAQFPGKVVQMKNEAIGLLEKMRKNTISIGGPAQVKSNRLKEPKWLN
jgi:arylsulfatase A-like enzyme